MRSKLMVSGATAAMVAALVAANPAVADPSETSYIVLMDAPPAVAMDTAPTADDPATAQPGTPRARGGDKANPNSRAAQRYRAELVAEQEAVQQSVLGSTETLHRYTAALNGFAAIMTAEEADALRQQKGVMAVMEDELQQPQTDVSPSFLGLDGGGEAWATGLDGEGVVIGVIDSGIWPEHASFADDGTYERPEGLADDIACDFGQAELPDGTTANDYNSEDAAFACNNKLIGARDMLTTYNALVGYETYASARDADGHGTHTASTAGGNADVDAEIFDIDRGSVTGVAPRASIIAYKGLGDLGGFTSDLAGSIDQAVADGVDVINYSIGSSTPSLVSADDISFLFAADAGVHVATSNGNSGPGAETVGSPASIPWLTSVGASTHTRGFENTVTLGDGTTFDGVSITEGLDDAPLVDSEDLGNTLCLPGDGFSEDVTGKVVLCERGQNARLEKSQVVADAGGAGMILFNPVPNQSLVTDNHYVPSSHVGPELGTVVKDYIDAAGADATAALTQAEKVEVEGSVMADFSSRGPTGSPASADVIKPDVTAPGVNILAGNTPTPTLGRPGQLFQSISGTSMSSPHVAGLMALIDQAEPEWSPAAVKSSLMTTARQDVTKEDAETPADPFDMGAGHVDPGKVVQPGSMFQPGIVYDAGINDYFAFLCGTTDAVNPALCDQLTAAGFSTDASDLNLASIAMSAVAGPTTTSRTVTNVSGRPLNLKATVDAPAGFDVEVSPARVRLAPGASATYEVVVRNVSAPAEEWRFGSLTWNGGGFVARSPIAVQGALFDAPDELTASGASGSTSFEVAFGYTGEYTAAPHGLAADQPETDTVVQDPDQTFSATDGYSTEIAVDLTDAALWRVVMEQSDVTGPGADQADLDLFLLDEDGNQVASSTSGGTDEIIDLVLPEPGSYTLYVHGWQTGGEELGFTAHTWTVPATPGTGNLSIDSAPSEATTGTTGTVEVSWDGAAAGTNLGAVSHSDADGLLGLTLVTVEN
ncbi:S8 family peptidase [Salsipaludibacter albus]|uniref:S8 family peptidase n=1 Tax=Salsipaludibacter albus TaxID=2849650 RepID=UPI001EE470D3|nr:S8 family peptidase [Salsipaludibacter albus]MBY5164477.1 S8 family serine peptidase [Salsipaludibacter albus]